MKITSSTARFGSTDFNARRFSASLSARIRIVVAALCLQFASSTLHAADGGATKATFLKHCAQCHSADGKARTPAARKLGVKDLTVSKTSDDEIRKQIVEGKTDSAGKPLMPAFKEKLTADEITALVAHVKDLRK